MDTVRKIKRYSDQHLAFLRSGYLSMNARDLTRAFNKRFGTSVTEIGIKSALQSHGIRCRRKHKDRLISRYSLYTEEQIRFVRENYAGRSVAEMTELFNERFGTNRTRQQIKTFVKNRGITSGRTGHFPKGHKPWNYGTKGQGLTRANSGSFKKGNVPQSLKPLWSERVCPRDGYISIKVPEADPYTGFPTRYKHKHVYNWEQEHGPVPEGMIVAFIDGDKTNCEPANLMLISRAELLNLNRHGYKDAPYELKPSIRMLSKLQLKVWAIKDKTTIKRKR